MDLSHIISGEEATVSQICMIVPDVDEAVEQHLAVSEAGPFSVWEYPEGFFQRLLYYGKPSPFTTFYYPSKMFSDAQTTLDILVTLEDAFIAVVEDARHAATAPPARIAGAA